MRLNKFIPLLIIGLSGVLYPQSKIVIDSLSGIYVPYGAVICADTIVVNVGAYYITEDSTGTCAGAVITGGGLIPVELASFSGSYSGDKIELLWHTATETNNKGFEVERRTTGGWERIGFVVGNGTSTEVHNYSFTDKLPLGNKIVQYRLKQLDLAGSYTYSDEISVSIAPLEYRLYQNYPNPFNASTVIRYSVSAKSKVVITLYDLLGEKVRSLADGEMEQGIYQVEVNAADLPSGMYMYVLQAGGYRMVKKMMLLK